MRRIFEPPPLRAVTEPPERPEAPARAPTDAGRTRTNTDLGARPLPKVPALPSLAARGGTPRTEARLVAPKAETEAALDKAIERISSDDLWDDIPEQFEAAPPPRLSEPEIEMVVEAEPPPASPPAPTRPPDISEPEIEITGLAEAADEDADAPAEMEMTVENDSAKIVEVVKDTSSQTITMTIDEPPEAEIVIVKPGRAITADDTTMVSGSIEPKRTKRRTDA